MSTSFSAKSHFIQAQNTLEAFLNNEENFVKIDQAIQLLANAFKQGGKVISCGNGGSHCDAMHFAEELTGRYRNNRKALPAIAISDASHISCVGNDFGFDFIFSRFVEAHGKSGDVLLGISTSGNSTNVINALNTARKLGMTTICLTGKDGGKIKDLCDLEIRAPYSEYADRAQEIHIKIIHALIDGVEHALELN
jgi:D-sedoheptulose 7-phosphate isomerase